MVATEVLDGPLPLARRQLADAVRQFIDRTPVWHDGIMRWEPALYTRMRGALTQGKADRGGRRMPASRVPCRTAALAWLCEVDGEISRWGPGGGTVHVLKDLVARQHRPQDADRLAGYAEQLARWAAEAATVLSDAVVVVPLRGTACPSCGVKQTVRRRDGELVRTPALTVSELGAECGACRASWSPAEFDWLARLLA